MTKSNLSLEHLKEFKNEINLLSEVQHPNVIKVYGSYEDAKRYYIVTDLYQGGELFDLVADPGCQMSENESADIMKQLLTAIAACHAKNIIHRDIKPENIMLQKKYKKGEKNKKIFLIDFGTALKTKQGTKETNFAGTPYYVSPEMIDKSYDSKTDIWSCGIMAHLLLSKQLPFGLMDLEDEDDIMDTIAQKR